MKYLTGVIGLLLLVFRPTAQIPFDGPYVRYLNNGVSLVNIIEEPRTAIFYDEADSMRTEKKIKGCCALKNKNKRTCKAGERL